MSIENIEPGELTEAQLQEVQRQEAAEEVARCWPDWAEVDVAVVVMVRSRGADADDARDRAVGAVWGQLLAKDNGMLPVSQRGIPMPTAKVNVYSASEIGRAAANGLLTVVPAKRRGHPGPG